MRFQTSETIPLQDPEIVLTALESCLRAISPDVVRSGSEITLRGLGPSPRAINRHDTTILHVQSEADQIIISADVTFQASAFLGDSSQDDVVRSKLDRVFDQVKLQLPRQPRKTSGALPVITHDVPSEPVTSRDLLEVSPRPDVAEQTRLQSTLEPAAAPSPEFEPKPISESQPELQDGVILSEEENSRISPSHPEALFDTAHEPISPPNPAHAATEPVPEPEPETKPPFELSSELRPELQPNAEFQPDSPAEIQTQTESQPEPMIEPQSKVGPEAESDASPVYEPIRRHAQPPLVQVAQEEPHLLLRPIHDPMPPPQSDSTSASGIAVALTFLLIGTGFFFLRQNPLLLSHLIQLTKLTSTPAVTAPPTSPSVEPSITPMPTQTVEHTSAPSTPPPVEPTATSSPAPTPSSTVNIADPKLWLEDWVAAMRTRDPAAQASFYADPVDRYLDKRNVSNAEVLAEKRAAIHNRDGLWTVKLENIHIDPPTGSTVTVRLTKHYMAETEPAQISEQFVASRLQLTRIHNQWKITSEQDLD